VGRNAAGHYDQDINGGYAEIILNGAINVSSTGVLASYGLITGSGQVEAASGATVIDLYVVRHWRGGSIAKETYSDDIYPMNESDCHNIQADLVINAGAHYWGSVRMYTADKTINLGWLGTQTIKGGFHYTLFHLIDSDGLIRLTGSSYIVKTYDAETGTTLKLYGGAKFSSSSMSLQIAYLIDMDLSTSDYVYPIDGGVHFELYNGDYTVSENFKLMPGCTVEVMPGANVTVENKKTLTMYNYDPDPGYTGNFGYMTATNYSSGTTAAQLILHGGATLTVNGSIGGQVVTASDATASNPATITLASGSTLSTTTKEVTDCTASKGVVSTDYTISTTSYTFSLALLNADGTASDVSPAKGTTYYASSTKWATSKDDLVEYEVTFVDANGATLYSTTALSGSTVTYGGATPAKDGYKFLGWAATENGTVIDPASVKITGNTSFYAVFEAIQYTVQLCKSDGTSISSSQIKYGTSYTLTTPSAETGYTFQGWATSKDGSVTYKAGASLSITGNTTLYAVYTRNSYTVTFYSDGSAASTQTVLYEGSVTTPTAPAKDGYKFLGWAATENGTVIDPASVKITENTNFYAVFELLPVSNITMDEAQIEIEIKTDSNSTDSSTDTGDSQTDSTAAAKVEAAVTIPKTTKLDTAKEIVISIATAVKNAIDKAINNATQTDSDTTAQADVSVTIPETVVEQMQDAPSLTIETGVVDVTFDKTALSKIVDTAKEITLQTQNKGTQDLTEDQQKALKSADATIIDLNLTDATGEKVAFSDNDTGNTGKADIKVPFTPTNGDGGDYAVYYISTDGQTKTKMASSWDNGYMTFTATHFSDYVIALASLEDEPEAALTTNNFENRAGTRTPATINVTDARTFTVTCSNACVVAYTTNGTDYTKLTYTEKISDNCYSFTVDKSVDLTNISIAVAIKGDGTLDGELTGKDAKWIQVAVAKETTLNSLMTLIADVTNDGDVTGKDAKMIQVYVAKEQNFSW
jgi:hypothetical protein